MLLALAFAHAAPLGAQQPRDTAAAPPLPRNASLVLSGGGARGLAHAGVLLGLEERGYDPPLVVGTSMGAVIGGLYAAGYAPAEIREVVLTQNWADMFTPDPFPVGPDRQPRRPLLSFGLAHPDGAGLEGFVAQASINRRLVQLLFDAGVRARNDFDALPRRFRAVTADLRDGDEVVLARGDLARAVRASMAVPGVFAPVRWDTLVLVDGGLANNVGTSVARALTGAPVIAVDVLHTLEEIDDVSALGVGLRAVRLLLLNARGGRDTAEAFVLPEIPATFTEASFPADASPLVRAGLAAALAQLSPATAASSAAREAAAPPAVLESLRVEGVTGALADLVRRTFQPALGRYDPARVLARVDALFATGMFHGVWPRVERTAGGAAVLVVHADAISPVVVTGAARWDSDVGAAAWSALRARPALPGPVELRAAVQLDRVERAASASSTWTPGLAPPWSLSVGGYWREHRVRSFDEDHELLEEPDVRRGGGWLALEWRRLRPQQALALAFRGERIVAERGEEGTSWGPYLRFGAFPPTSPVLGVENVLEAEWRFGSVAYTRVHASGSTSQRWRDLAVALVGDLTAVDGAPPLDALPQLGGLARVPWLRAGELRARATVIGGADVAWPLLPFITARLRVRSAAAGSTPGALPDARWLAGGEAAVIWQTALAPVSVGVAAGTEPGGAAWRLNLAVGSGW